MLLLPKPPGWNVPLIAPCNHSRYTSLELEIKTVSLVWFPLVSPKALLDLVVAVLLVCVRVVLAFDTDTLSETREL